MSQTMLMATAQTCLSELGYYTGDIDNIEGPKTRDAVSDFKRRHGFWARPYIGKLTAQLLFSGNAKPAAAAPPVRHDSDLPAWYREMLGYRGKHERTDNAELRSWLRSDGKTLGDPAKLPWCGDAVETAIANAVGRDGIPSNPYLARNWAAYGVECDEVVGAIAVFWRGSRNGTSGHVAFLAGEDASAYHVLGGNQSNSVNITRIAKNRLLALRWPAQARDALQIPITSRPATGRLSTNEA